MNHPENSFNYSKMKISFRISAIHPQVCGLLASLCSVDRTLYNAITELELISPVVPAADIPHARQYLLIIK